MPVGNKPYCLAAQPLSAFQSIGIYSISSCKVKKKKKRTASLVVLGGGVLGNKKSHASVLVVARTTMYGHADFALLDSWCHHSHSFQNE